MQMAGKRIVLQNLFSQVSTVEFPLNKIAMSASLKADSSNVGTVYNITEAFSHHLVIFMQSY